MMSPGQARLPNRLNLKLMTSARKEKRRLHQLFPFRERISSMWYVTLGLLLCGGVLFAVFFPKLRLPALLGYLLLGLLLRYTGLFDASFSSVSAELRKVALVIILLKAGLSLNLKDLRKVGRPAILLSFLPAVTEMALIGGLAPSLFPLSYTESFLLGAVLGAVSPAVVIPRMTRLMDEGYGIQKGIPGLVIAGSSMDDIVMMVFFQSFLSMENGGKPSAMTFLNIPISILSGVAAGILVGLLLSLLFAHLRMRDSLKLVLLLGLSSLLVATEHYLDPYFSFSSLLAVLTTGIVLFLRRKEAARRLALRFDKLWVASEMFLFVLVGASLDVGAVGKVILPTLLLILVSLLVRSLAVQASLISTPYSAKERTYIAFSYLPKATVQAALGGVLLDTGTKLGAERMVQAGNVVLSVSVLYILITAPLGAFLMDLSYRKMLTKDPDKEV